MITRCLYFIYLPLICLYGLADNSIIVDDFKISSQDGIPITVLERVIAVSEIHCSAICGRVSDCSGFTFQSSNMTCQIRHGTVASVAGSETSTFTSFIKTRNPECSDEYTWNLELDFCYKVYDKEQKTWEDARLACEGETENGRLVILDPVAKHQAVINDIRTNYAERDYFVGGRRYSLKGEFRWINGKRIDPTMWCPGQPYNFMCGNLWSTEGFCMDDSDCNLNESYICEKPLHL